MKTPQVHDFAKENLKTSLPQRNPGSGYTTNLLWIKEIDEEKHQESLLEGKLSSGCSKLTENIRVSKRSGNFFASCQMHSSILGDREAAAATSLTQIFTENQIYYQIHAALLV